jgi:hypothetical protein
VKRIGNGRVEWIAQQITEAFPWNDAPRYLIRDRDAIYGAAVTRRVRAMGIRDRPIAAGSPWQNCFAERPAIGRLSPFKYAILGWSIRQTPEASMLSPLIAIVGDVNPTRTFDPPMNDPAKAKRAAEELGAELAQRGARLLVYGGPFLETDVVRGFVAGKPSKDHVIVKCYSEDQKPPLFVEEVTHNRLFEPQAVKGAEWEIAFYRSITRADGLIIIGGANATSIVGQVAIGSRMPILALAEFGGAAKKVWNTLSAGEDLPNRDDINLMAKPWTDGSAAACVDALLAQHQRRRLAEGAPSPVF